MPDRTDRPAATVVIPARDSETTIAAAVEAIRDQRDGSGRWVEVIVVDDGSVDRTAEVARSAGAHVVSIANSGPARARNVGVSRARAPLIIFTDADCKAMPSFVEFILRPFRNERICGVKGSYLSVQRSLTARFVQQEYQQRYRRMARRKTIDFIDTYAAAYRASVLEKVGGFDESYRVPSTEDQDLSFRVAATGAVLVFEPEARVEHLHASTPWAYFRKKMKIGYYKIKTLRTHPAKTLDDSHTPLSLKAQILLLPLCIAGLVVALAAGSTHAVLLSMLLAPSLIFLATTLPLGVSALREDPAVGLLTPGFVVLRATALTLGMVRGLLSRDRLETPNEDQGGTDSADEAGRASSGNPLE